MNFSEYLYYIILFIFLLILLELYLKIARRFGIMDLPNLRSSHREETITGGGIIFYFALLVYFILNQSFPYFFIGATIIALLGFLDDRYNLPLPVRLSGHFTGTALLLWQVSFFQLPWLYWILAFVLIGGTLNSFNFMDGINGMTVFYSIITLITLLIIDGLVVPFHESSFTYSIIIALAIFGIYNFRSKAICFAGDVGSFSIAFVIVFLIMQLILKSSYWPFILLLSVYGVETVLTLIQRLFQGENIFNAHRNHLYQYFSNQFNIPHLTVSIFYGLVQIIVNILIILNFKYSIFKTLSITIILLSILSLIYIIIKFTIQKKLRNKVPVR